MGAFSLRVRADILKRHSLLNRDIGLWPSRKAEEIL
jgi:hypothetical protein